MVEGRSKSAFLELSILALPAQTERLFFALQVAMIVIEL